MAQFKQVGENLLKHTGSGTYYVQARVKGKLHRKSLKTKIRAIANEEKENVLNALRIEAEVEGVKPETWDAVVKLALDWFLDPDRNSRKLKRSTSKYWSQIAKTFADMEGKPQGFDKKDAKIWWAEYKEMYSASRANNGLGFAKRMGEIVKKYYPSRGNVFAEFKRLPPVKRVPDLPTRSEFQDIITEIRDMGRPQSLIVSQFYEFLGYSGLRVSELCWLKVEDINVGRGKIVVRGGEEGTKNHDERVVPIIQPMHDLLSRMELPEKGRIYQFPRAPRKALIGACERLEIRVLKPHDFRHFFATICAESGVDYPTLAKWLGHKDGGKIAAEVYQHIRDIHSEEMAAKVKL